MFHKSIMVFLMAVMMFLLMMMFLVTIIIRPLKSEPVFIPKIHQTETTIDGH